MFFEARDQGEMGMKDVAHNVLKRLSINHRGAETVCDVVYSYKQYSWMWDSIPDVAMDSELDELFLAYEIAKELITLYSQDKLNIPAIGTCENGATHYHATWTKPWWAPHMDQVCGIKGGHIFYIGK